MPRSAPLCTPPLASSASSFTAPNVDRQRPSARPGSICCGGGGPSPCGCPYCGIIDAFWLFWLEELAEPAATITAVATQSTRATLLGIIVGQYSAVPSSRRGCFRDPVVVPWQP